MPYTRPPQGAARPRRARCLAHLAGLTELRELYLSWTEITDAGLPHLAGLTQLHELHLSDTEVTDAGVAWLRRALPGCEIYR